MGKHIVLDTNCLLRSLSRQLASIPFPHVEVKKPEEFQSELNNSNDIGLRGFAVRETMKSCIVTFSLGNKRKMSFF